MLPSPLSLPLLLLCILLAVCARALRATFGPLSPLSLLSLFLSIFRSRVFYLSFSSLRRSLSLWQSRFYHVAILFLSNLSDAHTYTLFLFHSIEIFIIESRRDISSDMLVQRRFATLLSYRRFRGTQLYLICVPRDSARSIEPLTLMDSSGHFIHCRFIRGILNR